MEAIMDFIGSIDYSALKIIGMVLSAIIGVIMSWVAKRSVNYRKVDKRLLLSAFLFFLWLNGIPIVILNIVSIIFVVLILEGINVSNATQMVISMGLAILTCALLWGVIFRTKRMSEMFAKAKEESKGLFWQIHLVSLIPTIWAFLMLPGIVDSAMREEVFTQGTVIDTITWGFTAWWFTLMIIFVWRTSKYIFAEMKITLSDGEIIQYCCAPKMCRVHKNYVRLLKRNEKGIIIYERHINEGSIKQIEYFSESELGTPETESAPAISTS